MHLGVFKFRITYILLISYYYEMSFLSSIVTPNLVLFLLFFNSCIATLTLFYLVFAWYAFFNFQSFVFLYLRRTFFDSAYHLISSLTTYLLITIFHVFIFKIII